MNQVDRINGQNYSDNIIDSRLAFNQVGTWSVSTGTGSGTNSVGQSFEGTRSLYLLNNAPTTDILVTNSSQASIIPRDGVYGFSAYIRKNQTDQPFSGVINIFQNAVLYSAQSFVLGSSVAEDDLIVNDKWIKFDCDIPLTFTKADDITFTFQLDGIPASPLVTSAIYLDGLYLYSNERNNGFSALYTPPVLKMYKPTTQTTTVSLTASSNAVVLSDAASGNIIVTLPVVLNNLDIIVTVMKTDASVNTVTVDGDGSETINGATTRVLTDQWESVTVICNGTSWYII